MYCIDWLYIVLIWTVFDLTLCYNVLQKGLDPYVKY